MPSKMLVLNQAASSLTRRVAAPCFHPIVLAKFLPPIIYRTTSDAAGRRGRPYTKAEDELILRYRKEGLSYANIAKKLGAHGTGSVGNRYREHIAYRDSQHQDRLRARVRPENRALMTKIEEESGKGKRNFEIARDLEISVDKVRYLARLSGLRSGHQGRLWTAQESRELRDMRAKGARWGAIAIALGRSVSSVKQHVLWENRDAGDSTNLGPCPNNATFPPPARSRRKWTEKELTEVRELQGPCLNNATFPPPARSRRKWTEKELTEVRELQAQQTVPEIAQRLQRTVPSIRQCLFRQNLLRKMAPPFLADTLGSEVVILRERERLKWQEVADRLGRTMDSSRGIYRSWARRRPD
ncbi:hypothetical protein AC579_3099 [Pseudocercospora musae]|uniref:Myb-like domain-containing protein n=1 Tax=Pseudocercospora musae TaxID=113226 RepID=A0A139IBB0_9PEZI|nr:hypothetical protein AC579_3099 [Pseudocercospora musae]